MKKLFIQLLLILVMMQFSNVVIGQKTIFTMHPIDMDIPGIQCVKVFDLDGDGDFDIIGGSEHTPYSTSVGLLWWRNDGGNPVQWTKFFIDESFLHVMSVDVSYIDEDGFPDIVASSWENGKISWWKNSGNPETGWTPYDIVTGWINPHDAKCYDIDDDGDNDVIGVGSGDNIISVFNNQGGYIPAWQQQVVVSNFGSAKSVIIEDLNNDSLPDLIGAGDGCDDIAWWKNLGGIPISWNKQNITTFFNGSAGLDAIDMNNDGQLDIVGSAWEGNEVSFWICNDINANSWTKTLVTDTLGTAVRGTGRDIDMDGDKDIIAMGKIPGELVIFYNENDIFTRDVLYPAFEGGSALSVFDIDQDGDDDIIAGAGVLKKLYLFKNKTINTSVPTDSPTAYLLNIFPNPTNGSFVCELLDKRYCNIHVTMFDVCINTIDHAKIRVERNQVYIDVEGLNDGFYFIKVLTDQAIYIGKVVIEH